YAESECNVWYDASAKVEIPTPLGQTDTEPQILSLGNICLIDGSWMKKAEFSGSGWIWLDSLGKAQLMGAKNIICIESPLHSELAALRWAMECMIQYSTCQTFGTDCKDLIAMVKDLLAWPSFSTELEKI